MNTALIISLFAVACSLFVVFTGVIVSRAKNRKPTANHYESPEGWQVYVEGLGAVIYIGPDITVAFGGEVLAGDAGIQFFPTTYTVNFPEGKALSEAEAELYAQRVRDGLRAMNVPFEE
ncbi:hypothetical protein PQU92_04595 [Asticcacaulis sp. BYS171W]|uniref:Uncharacterized protein n=1 Tax=Asticcacaulis aquaticus TaxID=2984212 RepID=A0ABT5HR46_9CAUL|nr:hypothetical protein [Asticcacaulis aquaticus]MDC7682541.1 hypothetical protein [Asticcacaulis aquaticus]